MFKYLHITKCTYWQKDINMESIILFGFLLATSFWFVDGTGSGCQDIDHDACVSMAKQNSNICSDKVLSQMACPKYCNKCPVTCYNCNSTTSDISHCNTVTCNPGEMCLRTTVSGTGVTHMYKMSCAGAPLCSITRKRSRGHPDDMKSRSASINHHCCDSDLCNIPPQPSSTTHLTTSQTFVSSTRPTVHQTPPVTHATQKPACKRDIIIMLEDSSDLSWYYTNIKNSIRSVLTNLDIGHDQTRVALGTFGVLYGTKQWDLDRYRTKDDLLSAVSNLQPRGHQSNANNLVAIQYVLNNFKQGNRADIPDDVLFITEGHTLHIFSHRKENDAIYQLHQMSHNVIAVALGAVNVNEMRWVSTDNNHFIYIDNIFKFNMGSVVSKITNLLSCN